MLPISILLSALSFARPPSFRACGQTWLYREQILQTLSVDWGCTRHGQCASQGRQVGMFNVPQRPPRTHNVFAPTHTDGANIPPELQHRHARTAPAAKHGDRTSTAACTRAYALAHLRICDNDQELNGRLNPGAIVGATGQREVKTMDVLSRAREKVSRARPHMLTRARRQGANSTAQKGNQ